MVQKRHSKRPICIAGIWIGGLLALACLLLLPIGCNHQNSISDGGDFEIRLVSDHLMIFRGAPVQWSRLTFERTVYHGGPWIWLLVGGQTATTAHFLLPGPADPDVRTRCRTCWR